MKRLWRWLARLCVPDRALTSEPRRQLLMLCSKLEWVDWLPQPPGQPFLAQWYSRPAGTVLDASDLPKWLVPQLTYAQAAPILDDELR